VIVRGSVFGAVFSLLHNVRPYVVSPSHEFVLVVDHGANYPYAAIIARDFDGDDERRDTTIDEFVENDIRGVNQIILWAHERMRHWGILRLAGVYPDPDPKYRKENLALAAAFGCPVYTYSDAAHRSVSWGTSLMKARLLDARGKRHLFAARHLISEPQNVSPTGRGCIRGYMTQEWTERQRSFNIMEERADDWKDLPGTHGMDAHRYYCSHEYQHANPDGTLGTQSGLMVYK